MQQTIEIVGGELTSNFLESRLEVLSNLSSFSTQSPIFFSNLGKLEPFLQSNLVALSLVKIVRT